MPCCETIIITQETAQLNILTVGQQGPQGVAGVSGTAVIPNLVSGSSLSGHRLVYIDNAGTAQLASASDISHAGKVVAMTTSASSNGAATTALTIGLFTEPSWNFDTNLPLYLGDNGLITQVVPSKPTSLFSQIVGYVINPTTIYLQLETPIILN